VNGLRDDDAESIWGNRASFASDVSLREPNGVNGSGVQVLVREHSKKSNNPSFLSRKKSQGRSRPETKVGLVKRCVRCHC
jgi:serine/arginine repetitive matrix protein 2